MLFLSKKKWLFFGLILACILSSNVLIYRLEIMQPLPKEIVLGSLVDFLIVIPLITYFFIIRKRYSLKYEFIVVIASYLFATQIIPQELLSSYSFINYIFLICEAFIVSFELYIFFKLLKKLPSIMKHFKLNETAVPYFQNRLEHSIFKVIKYSRVVEILLTEIAIIYYSIFSWREKQDLNKIQMYTFHKKTSSIALNIMLIHALVLESIGLHYLIHSWSPVVSYMMLILNAYTLLFIIAGMQATRLCPLLITNEQLHIQVGIMKRLTVPIEEIKSIQFYNGPEKLSKNEQKYILDAVLSDFIKEKPTLEIEFFTPKTVKLLYGFKQKVLKVHLKPDEPQKFYEAISLKLG